ncbi:MAG: hypothetical protein H8K10_04955 [Nitrospira sp.]|nr:hypothetical protein [Nitrospira sp.]
MSPSTNRSRSVDESFRACFSIQGKGHHRLHSVKILRHIEKLYNLWESLQLNDSHQGGIPIMALCVDHLADSRKVAGGRHHEEAAAPASGSPHLPDRSLLFGIDAVEEMFALIFDRQRTAIR